MKSLSQMTEEELKTLCTSLESRYGENSTVTIKQSDFNNMWASIDRYAKENKYLREQLCIAINALQEYSCGNNWLDAGCRGQVFLPTRRGYSIADKALDEMEDVE